MSRPSSFAPTHGKNHHEDARDIANIPLEKPSVIKVTLIGLGKSLGGGGQKSGPHLLIQLEPN